MPSPVQSSNKGNKNRGKRRQQRRSRKWWTGLFDLLTHRLVVGGLWIVAALVCLLVVILDPSSLTAPAGWTQALSQPEMAQGLALAIALGLAGFAGRYWQRWSGQGVPDRVIDASQKIQEQSYLAGKIAVLMMVFGAIVMAGNWMTSHRAMPAGQLVLTVSQTQQTLSVKQGARDIEVMLPLRTTLQSVDFDGESPRANIQFASPGQESVSPREFVPGQSLDIDGMRFVFSGLSTSVTSLQAEFAAYEGGPSQIGDRIRPVSEGPSYRIVDITEQYLGIFGGASAMGDANLQLLMLSRGYPMDVMGPAVQLEDEQGRQFWIFERDHGVQNWPVEGMSLQLEGVQKIPSVVMTVTSVRPFWPFGFGFVLFVIGAALFLGFPEAVIRKTKNGVIELWSVNSVGHLQSIGTAKRRTTGVILVVVGTVAAIGAAAVFGVHGWSTSMPLEGVLWMAQFAAWLAMAATLLVAGIGSEKSVDRPLTSGAVTVALAVWAAMGAVVALGMRRTEGIDDVIGLPLVSDAGPVVWSIPGVIATSELEIPVFAAGGELAIMAVATCLLAAIGLVGAVIYRRRLCLFGWTGALLTAVTGLLQLLGVQGTLGTKVGANDAAYSEIGRQWLRSRQQQQLPPWLADLGEIQVLGELRLHTTALIPEILAFGFAAVLSAVMIGIILMQRGDNASSSAAKGAEYDLAGRDLFTNAVIFGFVAWAIGLILAWEHFGSVGVLAPVEWLGMSVCLFALGVLVVGWRRGPTIVERFARAFGPALVLCYLVWVAMIATAG